MVQAHEWGGRQSLHLVLLLPVILSLIELAILLRLLLLLLELARLLLVLRIAYRLISLEILVIAWLFSITIEKRLRVTIRAKGNARTNMTFVAYAFDTATNNAGADATNETD